MNIFKQIPENLKDELFEDIIKTDNLKIERIISYGHTSPKSGWYESKENEWVIVLKRIRKI
jgi:cupin 2 domain-containing protein